MRRQHGAAVLLLVLSAAVAAIGLVALLGRYSRQHVVQVSFWFDDVTFELPESRTRALGGPITLEERARMRAIAAAELRSAYAGLRVSVSEAAGGTYRLRVLQEFLARRGPANPAGRARPLGPLGGDGAVNFRTVAALAMYHAPPDADRAAIIDGIAKGIGRTAAHELGHLLLFGEHVRPSGDPESYEYESPDRAAQYYGSLHWDAAWPFLVKKYGR